MWLTHTSIMTAKTAEVIVLTTPGKLCHTITFPVLEESTDKQEEENVRHVYFVCMTKTIHENNLRKEHENVRHMPSD